MNSIDFSKKCIPYNKQYRDIFGEIPCPEDYVGTQDEFFAALQKSIKENKSIDNFLRKKTIPMGDGVKI